MRQREWQVPKRRWGKYLEAVTLKFEPAFLRALREFSDQESERVGTKVSQSTIVSQLALEADARLRRLYQRHTKGTPKGTSPTSSKSSKTRG